MLAPNFQYRLLRCKVLNPSRNGIRRVSGFGGATVHAHSLNHPNESMGFRIEYGSSALAYCLDHEHTESDAIHPGIVALAQDADMLVFDAAYCDETQL